MLDVKLIDTRGGKIGFHEELATLMNAYASDAEVIRKKLEYMQTVYAGFRRSRGDGNCYYRAAGFLFLETSPGVSALQRFKRLAEESAKREAQHASVVSGVNYMVPFLTKWIELGTAGVEWLEAFYFDMLCDEELDSSLVWATRGIAAEYARKNRDEQTPSGMTWSDLYMALGHENLESFLDTELLSWGVEAESAVQALLPRSLGVGMSIVQLCRQETPNREPVVYKFLPGSDDGSGYVARQHHISLLYKPGHYDMLYLNAVGGRVRKLETELRLRELCRAPWRCPRSCGVLIIVPCPVVSTQKRSLTSAEARPQERTWAPTTQKKRPRPKKSSR